MAQQTMWLYFLVFHLLLAVTGLAALWWFQILPEQLARFLVSIAESWPIHWLGLLGLTALGCLGLYIRYWRRAFQAIAIAHLFGEPNR